MSFQLIIFDCDGVLVDSEPISNRLFYQQLVKAGWSMSPELTFATFAGRSLKSSLSLAEDLHGRSLPEEFAKQYEADVMEHLKTELKPIDGITKALTNITMPGCVASSSSHQRIRLSLNVTGLLKKFGNNIFSSEDVARGKPAPDLFLYAARQMGFAPSKAAVIEDSIPGVTAGVAAGMTVFAYTGSVAAGDLTAAGANLTFSDMSLLLDLLSKYNSIEIPSGIQVTRDAML